MSYEKYVLKNGDRVRVVLEGPVTEAHDSAFAVGSGPRRNMIYPKNDHVISIEKLGHIWKVGDVVSGNDYTDEGIPLGTVAVDQRLGYSSTVVKTSSDWWAEVDHGRANVHSSASFDLPRTIVYIPS